MIKRILIVDDEENSRFGLGRLLTHDGYEVAEVANAGAALEFLHGETVHLIISDICMPGMNGLDLLREVQRRHPGTPVIMITAAGEVESYLEALHLGAFEYLNKPVKMDDLRALLRKISSQMAVEQFQPQQ